MIVYIYFFCSGIGDHVQCYYCDGGLKNWDPTDTPWIEHARWFGNCAYLQLKLGKDLINCIKSNNSLDPATVARKIGEQQQR